MKTHRLAGPVLFGITIACTTLQAVPAAAQVSVGVGISLPVPIVFVAPPQVVVLPGFDIYVAPDIAEEIYFVDGFWWRPWQGRWYRSHSYDSGWSHYSDVPYFYRNVRQGWRDDYRNHRWEGQNWDYERLSHQRVEQNWSSWKSSNYWQGRQNWGVPEMKSGKQRHDERSSVPASPQRAPRVESPPSQHRSSLPKSSAPQQRSVKPKAAPSQQGAAAPKAQKQNAQQSKGGAAKTSHGKGEGDKGGHGKPDGQNGGGKGKD